MILPCPLLSCGPVPAIEVCAQGRDAQNAGDSDAILADRVRRLLTEPAGPLDLVPGAPFQHRGRYAARLKMGFANRDGEIDLIERGLTTGVVR